MTEVRGSGGAPGLGAAAQEESSSPLRIFICYRRDDTRWAATSLYDKLKARFGDDAIFRDIDALEGGEDFERVIEEMLSSCHVVIVLIGSEWLRLTDDEGNRRIDDPSDFVRREIEAALKRDDVRVIPLLVEDSTPPKGQRSTENPPRARPPARRAADQRTS